MSKEQPNILIAGGGTGGHLYPALAIADEIKKLRPDADFLFVGTRDKIEARIVPTRGYRFATIWISGFHRSLSPTNLLFPVKVVVSLLQSFFLIQRIRPDAIVGTGGYVCGPVLYVGELLKIPTFIHESNSYPGVTTRLLAGKAIKVFIAFEATRKWLKQTRNVELVGTPTRSSLDSVSKESAIEFFGLDKRKQTVLVFGGSLGASSVNRALTAIALPLAAKGVQFIWQTGDKDYEGIKKNFEGSNIGWMGSYIDHMEYAYAAADVVISRSGATSIAELTRIGKPAILIPYPFAAGDHQTMNAKATEEQGAAIIVPDNKVEQTLEGVIEDLLGNSSKRKSMAVSSKALGRPNAGEVIALQILNVIESR